MLAAETTEAKILKKLLDDGSLSPSMVPPCN